MSTSPRRRLRAVSSRPRVVIAGGGVAAVEAVLALRDLAGRHVGIDMIVPVPVLPHRPSSVATPFGFGGPPTLDLGELAGREGTRRSRTHADAPAFRPRDLRPTVSAAWPFGRPGVRRAVAPQLRVADWPAGAVSSASMNPVRYLAAGAARKRLRGEGDGARAAERACERSEADQIGVSRQAPGRR
jgi:hypothetical protein